MLETNKEPAGAAGWVLIGALVLIGIALMGKYIGESGPGTAAAEKETAAQMAQTFVLKRLISPATAQFSPEDETQATSDGNGTWTVLGWVDSQNRFGALIRQNYRVTLKSVGGGQWRAEDVRIAER